MSDVYLNKVHIEVRYSKEVRAKGKRAKHVSKQTVIEKYYLEMILNENTKEDQILKSGLFKLKIKIKPKQQVFLNSIEKIKRLGL